MVCSVPSSGTERELLEGCGRSSTSGVGWVDCVGRAAIEKKLSRCTDRAGVHG